MAKTPKDVNDKSSSWWQTLPGVLTAIAATITAIAGLVAALNQSNLLPKSASPTADKSPLSEPSNASAPAQILPSQADKSVALKAGTESVVLEAGMETKFSYRDGTVTYKILAAQLEPMNAENWTLKLTIRTTVDSSTDFYVSADSFRLLIDGVPRAPGRSNNLGPVYGNSAEEGEILFSVPTLASSVVLRIIDRDATIAEIPLNLKSAQP